MPATYHYKQNLRLDATDAKVSGTIEQPGKPTMARRVVVVLGLLAGVAVIGGHNRPAEATNTIVIVVEGSRETIETYSTVVAEVLDDAGVTVATSDAVSPALDDILVDGEVVTVIRARSIVLDVDGTMTAVRVPAVTADAVVATLDVAEPGAAVTSSRDGRLPPDSTTRITVRNPVPVTVIADGVSRTVLTPSAPAAEILEAHNVAVGPDDMVEVTGAATTGATTTIGGSASVGSGSRVLVTRITRTIEQRDTVLAPPDEQRHSPAMLAGATFVERVGVAGLRSDTYEVTFHNGAWFAETLTASVETPAVSSITVVGTAVTAAASKNWEALAECESGGNPTIVSATGKYHGLYQFAVSTWQAVGGVGLPSRATPAEQTLRAMILFDMNGSKPWPHCGKYL